MARPSKRTIWLRRAGVIGIALAVIAAGTFAFRSEMRSTQRATAEAQATALASHVDRIRLLSNLASTRAELETTWNERTLRHAQRINADRRLDALYRRLLGVNEELSHLIASSKLHVLSLDVTKRCLMGVQRATEQASVDDVGGASASLDSVSDACSRASKAGRSS